MAMYDNEFEAKENKIYIKDKITEPQQNNTIRGTFFSYNT